MVLADDRILEYLLLEETGTPTQIANDGRITFSRTYINQRLGELSAHGMVRNLGNGVYTITEDGEGYLNGDVDANELPDTSEDGGTASA